jgi:hypothetical protein
MVNDLAGKVYKSSLHQPKESSFFSNHTNNNVRLSACMVIDVFSKDGKDQTSKDRV